MERIQSRVEVAENGCWNWTGYINANGYPGRIWFRGGREIVTHVALYAFRGIEVETGMHADHLCRNKGCVNPDHLEVVTPQVNYDRRIHSKALRTHCNHGHEFTEENTLWHTSGVNGKEYRRCRECHRASMSKGDRKLAPRPVVRCVHEAAEGK